MVQNGGKRRSKRSGKKRRASTKFLAAGNAWRAHVKETMRKNPNMKFGKPLLKLASRTYKKGSSGPSSPSSSSGVTIKTSKYDIKVRPRKTKAAKRKTKRPKRTSKKSKKSFFGF
jgi:hypothetical protein